jgi:hypothetical protein
MRIELVSQLLGQKYFEKVGDKIAQDHRGEKVNIRVASSCSFSQR